MYFKIYFAIFWQRAVVRSAAEMAAMGAEAPGFLALSASPIWPHFSFHSLLYSPLINTHSIDTYYVCLSPTFFFLRVLSLSRYKNMNIKGIMEHSQN